MKESKQHSQKIKEEADKLLSETKLYELLGQFGKVELGGSYAYDLMVDRDLDFGVAVESITPEIKSRIASLFASQTWAYSVNMTDRVNFEPLSNLGAPRGLFLGLTIPFPKDRWNIDVWFLVEEELPTDELADLIAKASQEQKDTILQIKYELLNNSQKEKGITSAEVYKAVLKDSISSTKEFLER
jgi:hypothetical protein